MCQEAEEEEKCKHDHQYGKHDHPHRGHHWRHHGTSGGIYFVAFVGAAVYYIQQATSFGGGVLGLLKAMVWPAMVLYKVLGMLQM